MGPVANTRTAEDGAHHESAGHEATGGQDALLARHEADNATQRVRGRENDKRPGDLVFEESLSTRP